MDDSRSEPPAGSEGTITWLTQHRGLVALVTTGLIALIMVLWGTSELFAPFPKQASTTCDPANRIVIKTMGRSEVTVSIYNAGAKAGTAGRFATQLAKLGFLVNTVANAPSGTQIPVAEVVGPSSTDPATMLVAATLGSSATVTSDPSLQLGPGINVFLGPRHRQLVKNPPKTVPLSSPQVICN